MSNKVAVLTGATGRVGRYIALKLVETGHNLTLVTRDGSKGEMFANILRRRCRSDATIQVYERLKHHDLILLLKEMFKTSRRGIERVARAYLFACFPDFISPNHVHHLCQLRDQQFQENPLCPHLLRFCLYPTISYVLHADLHHVSLARAHKIGRGRRPRLRCVGAAAGGGLAGQARAHRRTRELRGRDQPLGG